MTLTAPPCQAQPARLQFARTARALTERLSHVETKIYSILRPSGAFCLRQNAQRAALRAAGQCRRRQRLATERYKCERGVLSEYPAARARASYWSWFDNLELWWPHAVRVKGSGQCRVSIAVYFFILTVMINSPNQVLTHTARRYSDQSPSRARPRRASG